MMTPTLSLLLLVVTAQAQEKPEQRNFITDKLCLLGLGKVGETAVACLKISSPIMSKYHHHPCCVFNYSYYIMFQCKTEKVSDSAYYYPIQDYDMISQQPQVQRLVYRTQNIVFT